MYEIDVIQFLLDSGDGSAMGFNYFFTLVMFMGSCSFAVGLLVKVINRS